MTEAVAELRDVFCVHRTNEGDAAALQGTNLELARGEVLCVLGPSGAGKSTLLRVVAGVQQPSAGMVLVAGPRRRPHARPGQVAVPPRAGRASSGRRPGRAERRT